MCLALKYSHDHKVLHRDLKTSNVFLSRDGQVKLGDFGMAKNLLYTNQNLHNFVGTPLYLPPEIIKNEPYSYKADIWALGIVFYELLALKTPFMDFSYHGLLVKICNAPIEPLPEHYSPEIRNFVMMLLERDPINRPSVNDLFQTDFICQALAKNDREWEIFHSMKSRDSFQITDLQLRNDFNQLRTYRYSEYVGGQSQVISKDQLNSPTVNQNTVKPSRFGAVQNNHIMPLSYVDQESMLQNSDFMKRNCKEINLSAAQESEIYESPISREISENNKGQDDDQSTRKESVLISSHQHSTFKNGVGLTFDPSIFDSQATQLGGDSIGTDPCKLSLNDLNYSGFNSDFIQSGLECLRRTTNNANIVKDQFNLESNNEKMSGFFEFKRTDRLCSDDQNGLEEEMPRLDNNFLIEESQQKQSDNLLSPTASPKANRTEKHDCFTTTPQNPEVKKRHFDTNKYAQLAQVKKANKVDDQKGKKFKICNIRAGNKANTDNQSEIKSKMTPEINTLINQDHIKTSTPANVKRKSNSVTHKHLIARKIGKSITIKIIPRGFQMDTKLIGETDNSIANTKFLTESETKKVFANFAAEEHASDLIDKLHPKKLVGKTVSYQDINRIYRKSYLNEVAMLKQKYIELFDGKFTLVYSAVKKFVVTIGLKELEKWLNDERQIYELARNYGRELLEAVGSSRALAEMIRLNVLDIKSDLL